MNGDESLDSVDDVADGQELDRNRSSWCVANLNREWDSIRLYGDRHPPDTHDASYSKPKETKSRLDGKPRIWRDVASKREYLITNCERELNSR